MSETKPTHEEVEQALRAITGLYFCYNAPARVGECGYYVVSLGAMPETPAVDEIRRKISQHYSEEEKALVKNGDLKAIKEVQRTMLRGIAHHITSAPPLDNVSYNCNVLTDDNGKLITGSIRLLESGRDENFSQGNALRPQEVIDFANTQLSEDYVAPFAHKKVRADVVHEQDADPVKTALSRLLGVSNISKHVIGGDNQNFKEGYMFEVPSSVVRMLGQKYGDCSLSEVLTAGTPLERYDVTVSGKSNDGCRTEIFVRTGGDATIAGKPYCSPEQILNLVKMLPKDYEPPMSTFYRAMMESAHFCASALSIRSLEERRTSQVIEQ